MSSSKFFQNKTALITLIACSLVVIISLGVRQTFGLFYLDFSTDLGITITHFGVILMLVGGALTSFFSHEGSVIIDEGKISNYYENYYNKEFVIVNTSKNDGDFFTVFESPLLKKNNILSHESIPFQIEFLDFFINCKPLPNVLKKESSSCLITS